MCLLLRKPLCLRLAHVMLDCTQVPAVSLRPYHLGVRLPRVLFIYKLPRGRKEGYVPVTGIGLGDSRPGVEGQRKRKPLCPVYGGRARRKKRRGKTTVYEVLPELGKAIQALGEERYKGLVFKILYYLYFGYDLSKPFLPQYRANMAELMKLLKEEAKEEPACTP